MNAGFAFPAIALACLALSGCGNGPRLGESPEPMVVTKLSELPPPDGPGVPTYRISPLDKLAIVVADVPELTGTFQTDTAGRFLLPYAGEIDAAGRTPRELAAIIDQRLRGRFVIDPHVSVNIEEADSLNFTVDGQVNDPGSFRITSNMTLMRAVASAKGMNEYARLDDVVIFRTVKGEKMAALYNIGAIRRGIYADPIVYPGDMVVVGDSKARRTLQQLMTALPLLTTPIIVALQR